MSAKNPITNIRLNAIESKVDMRQRQLTSQTISSLEHDRSSDSRERVNFRRSQTRKIANSDVPISSLPGNKHCPEKVNSSTENG